MNKYDVVVTNVGFKQDTLYIEATVNYPYLKEGASTKEF